MNNRIRSIGPKAPVSQDDIESDFLNEIADLRDNAEEMRASELSKTFRWPKGHPFFGTYAMLTVGFDSDEDEDEGVDGKVTKLI